MGSSNYTYIDLESTSCSIESQLLKVIEKVKNNVDERLISLMDLYTLFCDQIIKNNKREYLEFLMKSELIDVLCSIMSDEHDKEILKVTFLLFMSIIEDYSFEEMEEKEKKEEFINYLMKMIMRGEGNIKERGIEVLNKWIKKDKGIIEYVQDSYLINNSVSLLSSSSSSSSSSTTIIPLSLKSKISLLSLLLSLIEEGIELKNEEELIRIGDELEQEGNEKEEEEEEEERREWERLNTTAHLLVRKIMKKKDKREGKKNETLLTIRMRREEERIEKEKLLIEKEEWEEEKKELLSHMVREMKEEKQDDNSSSVPSTTSLSSLSINYSNEDVFEVNENEIRKTDNTFDTFTIGDLLSNGIFQITFEVVNCSQHILMGILPSYQSSPPTFPMIDFTLFPCFNIFSSRLFIRKVCFSRELDDSKTPGRRIMMEIDLRDSNEKNRTLHYFVDGQQQMAYFNNLPPSVIFAIVMMDSNDCLKFISFEKVSSPLSKHLNGESRVVVK